MTIAKSPGKRVRKAGVLAAALAFAIAAPAYADVYQLNSPTGSLGNSQNYIGSGPVISAYGFDCFAVCGSDTSNAATALWGDSLTGLGIASDANHQITQTSFVMFDWTNLAPDFDSRVKFLPFFTLDDNFSQRRGVRVYFSNTLGVLETQAQSTDVLQDSEFGNTGYQYIAFSGWDVGDPRTDDSFTITTVVSGVPEPEVYAMMGLGLGVIGWASRRRSKPESSKPE